VLLGKEEKETLCLHRQRGLHYPFVYKIWAGQIAWKTKQYFEEQKKYGRIKHIIQ
jgi:hypothetical protein